MMTFLRRLALTLVVFLLLDLTWILGFMFRFYDHQLGALALRGPDGHLAAAPLPSLLVYLVLAIGVVVFAQPAVRERRTGWMTAALFGLVCYGTYDLSNLATLKGWPLPVVLVDMGWGALVSTLTSVIVVELERRADARRARNAA